MKPPPAVTNAVSWRSDGVKSVALIVQTIFYEENKL